MPISDGRGNDKKKQILERYKFRATMHAPLLNGKSIKCVCGDRVRRSFYQFDAVDPDTGKVVDTLYAGAGSSNSCASKLIELSGSTESPILPIPFFNPLRIPRAAGAGDHGAGGGSGQQGLTVAMAPLNVEIEQAILLTLLCWGELLAPGQAFSEILAEIRQHPDRPLLDMRVRSVNTAIGNKRSNDLTLTQMLALERAKNPTLKHYTFPLMTAALQREEAKKGTPYPSKL